MNGVTIQRISTPRELELAKAIRRHVFIEEQGVPAELEQDGADATCTHVLALRGDQALGTGRYRPLYGFLKFERLAVLSTARGLGVGRAMVEFMVRDCDVMDPLLLPYLHAQAAACDFYRALGWTAVGDAFEEAAIPHQRFVYFAKDAARRALQLKRARTAAAHRSLFEGITD